MKKLTISIAALLLFLALAPRLQAASVDTLAIASKHLGTTSKVVVVKPNTYDNEPLQMFPVVYILHGYSDNYATWIQKMPDLAKYADQYEMMIVCPDGGYDSWYLNSTVVTDYQYESYITEELVQQIDTDYRTKKSASFRAITGHSMGGHGAMYLGINYPQLFGVVGSIAGGVDLTFDVNRWNIKARIGSFEKNQQEWYSHSVINLVNQLRGKPNLKLIIDCGYDDFFFGINQNLHQVMLEKGIEHVYMNRSGKHNWAYFPEAMKYQLFYFKECFQ